MSNTVDVRFTCTTFNKLDDIPYVEGQIISISDRPGYYYDMGGKRKQASGSLDVCMFFDKSGIPISIWDYGRDIYPGPVYNVDQIAYAYISSKVTGIDFEAFAGSDLKAVYIDNYPENIDLENTQFIPGLNINYLNNKNSFDVIAQAMSNLGKGISNKVDKGTTLSDYGITDAYTSITIDSKLSKKVDKGKSLQDYGIEDAYRKQDVDILPVLSSMYLLPLYDRYNVKDYGAVGSGFVDDTLSIQNTLDEASQHDNKFVYVPHGKYILSDSLILDGVSNLTIVFDGKLAIESDSDFSAIVLRGCSNINIVNLSIHSEHGNNVGVEILDSDNVDVYKMTSHSMRSDILIPGDPNQFHSNTNHNIYVHALSSRNSLNCITSYYTDGLEIYDFDIQPRYNSDDEYGSFYFFDSDNVDIHHGNIRAVPTSPSPVIGAYNNGNQETRLTISNIHCTGCSVFYKSDTVLHNSYISNCIIHSNNVNHSVFNIVGHSTTYITGCDIYSSEYLITSVGSHVTVSSSNLVCRSLIRSGYYPGTRFTHLEFNGSVITVSGTCVSEIDGDTVLISGCTINCLKGSNICSGDYSDYTGQLVFKNCEFEVPDSVYCPTFFENCSNLSATLVNCNLSSRYVLTDSPDFEPRLISCTYDNNYDKIIGYTYM